MNVETLQQKLANQELTCMEVKEMFNHYADIDFLPIENREDLQAFYCKGMLDTTQLNEYYNRILLSIEEEVSRSHSEMLPPVQHVSSIKEIATLVFSGSFIVYRERTPYFHVFDLSKVPQRSPQESTTDVSIKGPKDSFTEEIDTNIALIRKRIKTAQLYSESFKLGTISNTDVSLLYLQNKANPDILEEVRKRLTEFNSENVSSSGQLEQW